MASDGLWGDFDKSVAPAASASSAAPAKGLWGDFDHPPPAPPPEPSLTDRLAAGISHIGDALKGVDLKAALGATGSQDYGKGASYLIDNPITRGLGQGANTAATGLNELIDRVLVKPADAGVSMLGGHSDLSGSFNRVAIAPGVANEAALSAPTSAGLGSAATQTGSSLLGSIATALATGGADTAAPAAIHDAEPGLGSMLASAITSPQTRTAGILGTESAADQAAQQGAQGKPMGNADLANLALAHTAGNLLPMGHGLPLLARPVVGALSGVAGQALGDQASNQPADLSHYLASAGTAALLSLIPGGHAMPPDLEAQLRSKYGDEAVNAAKAAMAQPAPDASRAAPSAIPDAEFTKALPEPVVAVDRAGTAMTSADFLAKAKQAQADAEATVAAGQQRADLGITPDIARTQGARWEAQQAAALDNQAHLDARTAAQDELAQQGTDDTPPWWMGARGGELDHEATSMPQPAATPSAAAEATASSPVNPRAAAPVVDLASADHPDIEPLRQEIGWDTVGGKMIRGGEVNNDLSSGAGFGRTSGDVVGRTPWVGKPGPQGESDFWRLRPIEGGKISEQGAHAAMDKAAAGEPLNAKERRFIDYARETAQHYDDAYQADLQQHQQDQADMDGSAKASAMQELHANGAEYDPADHAEAATISQLISRAHDAGATPRQMRDAIATGGKTDKARALWDLTRRLEATDGADRQAVQPGGRGGDEAPHERQAAADSASQQPVDTHAHGGEAAAGEVAPARPARDLFAAPTPAEHVRAATEARDAERNGQTGGKTDTRDGGLFDGQRPEQTRVPEALDSTDATRQASRDQGNADADRLGIRAAVTKALGPVADRVEYLHGYAGLPENMRKGVESRNALGRKGVTAAMYSPDTGRVFLFTDAVKTPERAVWHAAHEIAGHAGLRALLGDRLNPALGIALQNPTVKALADEIFQQRKIGEQMKQSGKSHADGLLLSAEEALAELGAAIRTDDFEHIKSRYGVDVPPGMRVSVKAAIANFLRRLKVMIDDLFGKHTFSDEDVRSLMESAWQAAKESPASGKPGEAAMDRMAAEPHEVDSTEDQTDTLAAKPSILESLDHAGPATGVKNEQVASERRARGMDALDAEGKRTFGEVWDTARRKLDDNPQHGQVLAEQIADHPRALNAEETAVLSQDRARIAVQRSTAAREAIEARSAGDVAGEAIAGEKLRLADEQMAVNDRAARSSGYEQGLGLAMRKAMAELDYSLGAMQQRLEASKGTPLTPEEHARLQKLHDAMGANAEALAAAEQKAKAPKAARDAKLTEGEARDRIRQAKRDLKDADATRNAVRQKQLRKDIVELELRMAKGEFEKGKRQPYAYNEATQQLLADRNFLRRKFDRMAAEAKHQASSKPHKLMSTLLSFRRAMLLSSIQTLGKLTAAASYRVALGPIEHGVQGALGQLPGLRGIAAKAPTEGRFSARAEGHAIKQTFSRDTLRDMKAKLLHGEAVNDLLYGKFHASLHPFLELVGNLHAALKTPAERNAFARAQTLAAEHETRRVFDAGMSPAEVADHMASPAMQALLGARAFEESQRAVLKNKNFVNSAYSMLHHALDNAGAEGSAERTAGKTTARVLDYVFPIVKVPTNFALESTSYALGAAKAAVQLIAAKGVKNLTPEQADYIMRNLGKQTIGAALMAIGWYNAKQVGTFYQSGDNKRHGRPEEGSAFGIPKWALDTPAGMLLTIGATMHRIDAGIPKARGGIAKGTGGVGNAVLANVRGVAGSVPFFGEPGRIASDFTSTDSLGKGLGKELASAVVPPDVRRLATHQDNGKKRDPKNFLDELKAGVPGLRQQVPEKHQRY